MQSRVEALEEVEAKIRQVGMDLAIATAEQIRFLLTPEMQALKVFGMELHTVKLDAFVAKVVGEDQFNAGDITADEYDVLITDYEEALERSKQHTAHEESELSGFTAKINSLEAELDGLRARLFLLSDPIIISTY